MKVSDEARRSEMRAEAASHPEGTTAEWWIEMAELWAEAMEPYLDAGTPISIAAPTAFNAVVPQTGNDTIGVYSRAHDFMVEYLQECWLYGEALDIWYGADRPTQG